MSLSWLSELCGSSRRKEVVATEVTSGVGLICCTRPGRTGATAQLIVRQRVVASELSAAIPAAISSASEGLELAMGPHLPAGDSLSTTLSSPQFSQALSMFWSALQSGQAAPVVRQFGLGPEAVTAAASGNIESFVGALETEAKSPSDANAGDNNAKGDASTEKSSADGKSTSQQTKSDKKDDDDEGMALD